MVNTCSIAIPLHNYITVIQILLSVKKALPLCFDGTTKITPSDKENIYYIEVLDSVTREEGTLNITKYLTHPDGFQEKVFIDKFTFGIIPLPETVIFIGNSHSFEKINVNNLELKVGLGNLNRYLILKL